MDATALLDSICLFDDDFTLFQIQEILYAWKDFSQHRIYCGSYY